MARFYGEIKGNRGEATRQGSKESGIRAHVRGWDIGIAADVYDHDGADYVSIGITGGSNNSSILLDLGTFKLVSGKAVKVS